jgi:hypothetical protein
LNGTKNKNITSTQFYLAGTGAHSVAFTEVLASGFRSKVITTKTAEKRPTGCKALTWAKAPQSRK